MRLKKNYCCPRNTEALFGLWLLAPCLACVGVFAFYPILYSVYLSMHRLILSLPGLGRSFILLDNYRSLLQDPLAREALVNTLAFVAASTSLEVLAGLGIALIINRHFRGRGLVRAAVLIPWALPTVVAAQMWRFIMNDSYGLANLIAFGADTGQYRAWLADPAFAFVALVAADVWKTSCFAALIILAGLQTIPDELYEAAALDGATAWQRFCRITLPLLRPSLLIALLFRTMDAFRIFDLVFVMTQGGPGGSTSVLQFYGYQKIFSEGLMGYGSAVSVLVFCVTLSVSAIYIKMIGGRLLKDTP
jgi:multiple sugar transport system permease protein